MLLKNVSQLKLIFVTDIHLNHEAIDKLQQWTLQHLNSQSNFDYCLVGGDIANCNYQTNKHDQQAMFNQTIVILKRLRNILGCKVLFIPGNHDCKCFFQNQWNADNLANIHSKVVELSEGLHLLGFGGSTPAYRIKAVNDPHEDAFWAGYPYFSEGDIRKEWEKGGLGKMLEQWEKTHPQNQLILMTHTGPRLSQTTIDTIEVHPQLVSCGSEYLNKMADKKYGLCWLHGHVHKGSKYVTHTNLPIMNPGALKNNEFMYFQLIKDNNLWRVSTKVFEELI